MLLCTLCASLLGDLLFGKKGKEVIKQEKQLLKLAMDIRGFQKGFIKNILIPSHRLTNFETEVY